MQNSTNSGEPEGILSGTQIVTITLSCCSLLGTLLTFAYIKIKSQFRDKQDSKIELTNEVTKKGEEITTLNKLTIIYRNDELYAEETVTTQNGKNERKESLTPETFKDYSKVDEVLNNNHQGDLIIAGSRKSLENKALNTYIKSIYIAQGRESIVGLEEITYFLNKNKSSSGTDVILLGDDSV